jgi:DMATS type aromatic prenyltransferase
VSVTASKAATYGDVSVEALSRLERVLSLPRGAAQSMADAFARNVGPLSTWPVPPTAPWPCEISDDSTPFEFSLVLDSKHPQVRMLWESQGASGDLRARLRAGLDTQQRLCLPASENAERFAAVSDLFLPEDPQGPFVLWHAARIWPTDDPELKVYFNPRVRGPMRAAALVQEALERLGYGEAWNHVLPTMSRGPFLDEIRYFSLDLVSDEPRVKVYVYHREPTPEVLAAAAATATQSEPDRIVEFYTRLTQWGEPAPGFAPGTCLSFTRRGGAAPVTATLHVPVRGYVGNDEDACARVESLTAPDSTGRPLLDADAAALCRTAAEGIGTRSLDAGVGRVTYVSLRSRRGADRVTCYLATETFGVTRHRAPRAVVSIPPLEQLVVECEREPLTVHPFLQRMLRTTIDVRHMWLMFENVRVGLSEHFVRRLAHAIARVDDDRIRSPLAKQLHEELGSGDAERTHRKLMGQLIETLRRWRPENVSEAMLEPARALSARLEAIYYDPHPYVAVGGAIVIELLGKQVDLFVAEQFRRQAELGIPSLEWLTLHEGLELEHASESLDIARCVEIESDRAAAWRGGRAVYLAGWAFFDDMYKLCFG